MKNTFNLALLLMLMIVTNSLKSQTKYFEGILLNKDNKEPVEFVAISTKANSTYGVMSDDKGRFRIKYSKDKDSLYIMPCDFEMKVIAIKDINKNKIYLNPLKTNLDTVNVKAMGAKTLFFAALDSVKNNFYYKKSFALDVEGFNMLKKQDSIITLLKTEDIWSRKNLLFVRTILPFDNIYMKYVVTNDKKRQYFQLNDILYYYMFPILNTFAYKQLVGNNTSYSMKILKKDSVETGYIITIKQIKDTKRIETPMLVPKIVKFYIDAKGFVIKKIEQTLDTTKNNIYIVDNSIMDKKDTTKTYINLLNYTVTVNFSEKQGKYFLSNCFSNIKYYKDDNKDTVFQEKIMYDTKECRVEPDKFEKQKIGKKSWFGVYRKLNHRKIENSIEDVKKKTNEQKMQELLKEDDIKFFVEKE
ncbi:MAG: hypothetical protein LKE30_04900 [Bacteroidales bacterium]|jgi:hypothetical protein|nr:hypothetical protein [Bacteroidales bacterium]